MANNVGPHPLFEGMWTTYFADQRWRADIPKATDKGMVNGWIVWQRQTTPRPHKGIGRVPKKEGDY